ncbi:M23 family metallopeptidase [Mycobacterium sp. 852002-51152_SCH6134967]|uniref:M23 family metallopeptidase n=1 Tax=Mycobacterium sp. 852002-51152_SCH6134967 TaxID=1834096 RepID=UPI0009EE6D59|nr:M23 family metallopeptidase [Mycobacterium sp. 852002-51152_SCH6134967]
MRPAVAALGVAALIAACSQGTDPPAATSPAESSPQTTTASTAPGPLRGPAPSVATPIVGDAISQPVPVLATDGRKHLVYEVSLTNTLPHPVTLKSITVLDRDVALLDLEGDQLAQWTRIIGTPSPTTAIGPAQTAVVWFDVALDEDVQTPSRLTHAVALSNPDPQDPLFPADQTVDIAPVEVQPREPVVLRPPLRGAGWVDAGGCCGTSAHRTALNPINGRLWAAERFAIDYVQLDPDGRLITGDPSKPESFAFFGADIHAVRDGRVVSVLDGLPEQVPGRNPTGLPLNQYAGNHVVQDLGDGNYALYAHIKTGTVAVKPGDRLTAGQVLGEVGNTGNSTAPHLHFHVMSSPDPLGSNGLPFVFDDFRVDARMVDDDDVNGPLFEGEAAKLQPGFTARDEKNAMPLELDVMTYADR